MSDIVEPKSLPGTMELLPADQIKFNEIKNKIERVYKSFGFLPIDTPVIEKSEVLLAKAGGETEKQIYQFKKGDNDICLRFDLTVPLAKFVAANINELEFPFKRYQIGKVYRGEKAQKGRYREFYQADIDIIGKGELSLANDAECPAIIYQIFKDLDFGEFVINLNNRKIVSGLLAELGLEDKKTEVMRSVDKLDKIGEENVKQSLTELGANKNQLKVLMDFMKISGKIERQIEQLHSFKIANEQFKQGVSELETVVKLILAQGVPEKNLAINLSIVRGLDYYTGTVFETFLTDYPSIGSVCSGGRYDNLSGFYTKEKLPGVGISIGLTRLFYQLQEKNLIKTNAISGAQFLILPMANEFLPACFKVAEKLRKQNKSVQVYLEDKKFKNKLAYADKLQIPFVIIIGEDELKNNCFTLKNMQTHTQEIISLDNLKNSWMNKIIKHIIK